MLNNIDFSYVISFFLLFIILMIIVYKKYKEYSKNLFDKYKTPFDKEKIDEIIDISGYSYDETQDIFFSNIDAWQRKMGYCRLYDEAAAPLGMIIDCEPIYFEYDNKRWLIEFWKGQYDLCTGAEIGIYYTTGPDLDIPDFFNGTFYNAVKDEDFLEMSFVLKKNNRTILKRKSSHWWLTGFRVGEFSEPEELTMDIKIVFKNRDMTNNFIKGLRNANYSNTEIIQRGNIIRLKFDKPHVEQPYTRNEKTDKVIQFKNKELCDKYELLTEPYDTFPEKLDILYKKSPDLYKEVLNIGRPKKLIEIYKEIQKYIDSKEED
ncbi:DUF4474 domain-containing protein [Senegalia massiliensis]|uniref:DUF4474 domain-containing protein n=1 Tax=Senegalia massiliensis TaxID=1720316 RepID=UPI001F5ED03A|nr:DUF4474 domain-containing protein [Senegalia massiliensis]